MKGINLKSILLIMKVSIILFVLFFIFSSYFDYLRDNFALSLIYINLTLAVLAFIFSIESYNSNKNFKIHLCVGTFFLIITVMATLYVVLV